MVRPERFELPTPSQKDLIDYQYDDEDRRQIHVRLTKQGHTVIKSVVTQSCSPY
jgi:DNA-binding MarR family transcriptional regulator